MGFRNRKKKSKHTLLSEEPAKELAPMASTEFQPVVDALLEARHSKIFHPNCGSRAIVPCKIKKLRADGKVTIELVPYMRVENGVSRFRVRLDKVKVFNFETLKQEVKKSQLHLVSIGDFINGRFNATFWNWEAGTPMPDCNPPIEESINARLTPQ